MTHNIKYATLLSVAMAYNEMVLDSEQFKTYDNEAKSMFLQFGKFCKRTIVKLNRAEAIKAEECFNKIKVLDSELFENKGFAPTILVLFILIYLRDEMEIRELKIRFSHFNILEFIGEIDKQNNLRSHSFYHSFVLDEFLKVFDEKKVA